MKEYSVNRTIDNSGVFQSRSKIEVILIQLLLTAVVCGGMALGLLVLEKQSVAFPFTSVAAVACTAQSADMAGRKWLRLAGRSNGTGTGTALVVLVRVGVRAARAAV